jgi:hypothetical protein
MSVPAVCQIFRQRAREGWFMVAPVAAFLDSALHPAFFKEASCMAGF